MQLPNLVAPPEVPEDAADTLPPDGPGALQVPKRAGQTGGPKKRRRKKKPAGAAATGGASRRVPSPEGAPARRGVSRSAVTVAVLGGALLLIGVLVVVLR